MTESQKQAVGELLEFSKRGTLDIPGDPRLRMAAHAVSNMLEQAQREVVGAHKQAALNLAIADKAQRERDEARAKLLVFHNLADACRIRLTAEGWTDTDSDTEAIKHYILNSEYHAQTGN